MATSSRFLAPISLVIIASGLDDGIPVEAIFLSSVNFIIRLPLSQIQCLLNQMFSYLMHH